MQTSTQSRRQFIRRMTGGALMMGFASPLLGSSFSDAALVWHDVKEWGIEGKGWTDTTRYFDRLPSKAEGLVRDPVWQLSRHSAGMLTRFETDAPEIHVRYELFSERLALPHMPATGVSGVDLYGQDVQGIDRWISVNKPVAQQFEGRLVDSLLPGRRRYTIYLPLYNGVNTLEIGVPEGHHFEGIAPRDERPILFYGTSILHGACASRPGMAFPAILGRRLGRPVYNLGFSGNGKMEPEVGALLAELDPCLFVIDCVPNMDGDMIRERAEPLVRQLRAAHPDTPILLTEDRTNTNANFRPVRLKRHLENREALRAALRNLRKAGLSGLYYLEGAELLGLDGEAATDGSHPSDLGMVRYADAYEPVIREILGQY